MAEGTRPRLATLGALALLVTLPSTGAVRASEEDPDEETKGREGIGYSIPAGEKHKGDLYLFRDSVRVMGEQVGDLVSLTRSVQIPGTVDGDLFVFAQTLEITGTVRDSVRVFAESVTVSGTIEGDLLAFAKTVSLLPTSRVTGSFSMFGQSASIQGTLENDLKFAGGQITIAGHVGGGARIKCDQIQVDPGARIAGDLTYSSRNRLDLEGKGIVGGAVAYQERKAKEEEHEEKPLVSKGRILWFLMRLTSSFLAGLVALKALSGPSSRAVATVTLTPLWSAGVGFIALIVTPGAALLLVLFIVTIPLAVVLLLLWLVGLYVAKIPVAVWLGNRLLRALGRPSPSAVWSLLLGLLVLYPVFSVPWCVGNLVCLGCVLVGLGAIIAGAREPRSVTSAPGAVAPGQATAPSGPPPI